MSTVVLNPLYHNEEHVESWRRMSARSQPSEGFIVGQWEDSDENDGASENDEVVGQLVPMKLGGTVYGTAAPRRKRTQSRSKACSFYDFYTLKDDHLGAGAYGSVRTCVQKTSGQEMAVKLVDKWFEDSEYYYMVFEKMRGGPLLNHIQRRGCFTEAEASRVTKDIASALMFLHDQGIAHRDVKPENILCTEPDRVSPVKLCDLDLASKAVPASPPRLSSVASEPDLASPVGSAEFMAPEVVDAYVGEALKYDKRCDMWSLGVIVYIMLCGYPPFYGGDCEEENCGWDEGEACEECQNRLFQRIQSGVYDFPEEEWDGVSNEAKHLIGSLLLRDARKRLTAAQVLCHPWLVGGAPATQLSTPCILYRNDSARDVHQMSEHFNIASRLAVVTLDEGDESASSTPSCSPMVRADPSSLSNSLFPSPPPEKNGLAMSSARSTTPSYPSTSLLSCQHAVARVDSLSEMHPSASREGQVNV